MNRIAPVLVLLLSACGSADAQPEVDGDAVASADIAMAQTGVRVEVAEIALTSARLDLTLPGEIQGNRDALLASAMGGYVEAVSVSAGDEVKKGASIARIDAEIHAASLDQAEAQLALAQSELGRVQKMGDLASPAQLQAAETQVAVMEAAVRQARAQLSRASIRAPFSGVVAQVGIEHGEVASPAQAVARLVDLDPVKVTLAVSDQDVMNLTVGQAADVSTPATAEIHRGVVAHIGVAADLRTRSFPVEVEVPNPDRALLPGMIAQVHVARDVAEGAVVIPQDWIVTRLDGTGVFIDDEGTALWRPLTLGAVVHGQVVVESGLEVGERLVITGHRELVAGDPLLISREGRCCENGRPTF